MGSSFAQFFRTPALAIQRLMKCTEYFLRLLSRREYSVNELMKKGKEKGFEQEDITGAIEDLQTKGYQSDSRLITQMISSFQGKYGKPMVKRKCLEKGIAVELFEQVWMEQQEISDNDVHDNLADLKAKVMRKYKIQDIQNIDPKTKLKLINYLKYRGFNAFELLVRWQREEE